MIEVNFLSEKVLEMSAVSSSLSGQWFVADVNWEKEEYLIIAEGSWNENSVSDETPNTFKKEMIFQLFSLVDSNVATIPHHFKRIKHLGPTIKIGGGLLLHVPQGRALKEYLRRDPNRAIFEKE